MDIASNLPFIFVGVHGFLFGGGSIEWSIFYVGIFFVGIGSAYYHQMPNNKTLIWDRLPMTVGFMSFLYIFLNQRFEISSIWLYLFLFFGVLSVVYWAKYDDLIPYAIVQFGPLIIIPFIMLNDPQYGDSKIWKAFLSYFMAKVFEVFDKWVFKMTNRIISGHTIKHLFSALGIYYLML